MVTASVAQESRRETTPTWGVAGRVGPRHHHADATAGHHSNRTGRVAVALADGVGDSAAAAFAATVVADHAVRVATLEGDPAAGVVAAGDLLRSAGDLIAGDAALVVALAPAPGADRWTLAWVGDCRAYAFDGFALHTVTRDHTVAEQMRAAGLTAAPRFEHVLSTSVRTAAPAEVGMTSWSARGLRSLMLVSDGVHRAVAPQRMAAILAASVGYASPADRAEWVLDAAEEGRTTDNATALVVDTGAAAAAAPTIPAQRGPASGRPSGSGRGRPTVGAA